MDRPDGEGLSCARMAVSAGMGKVGGVDRGSRIARRENIVDPVAGSAVCDGLRTGARRESVKAVRERGHAVGGKVVASFDPRVAVAAPARRDGNARGVYRRLRIRGRENGMFPMAIGAHGSVGSALRCRFAVDGLVIHLLDLRV